MPIVKITEGSYRRFKYAVREIPGEFHRKIEEWWHEAGLFEYEDDL